MTKKYSGAAMIETLFILSLIVYVIGSFVVIICEDAMD
jgi:hypothetical protein